MKRLSIKVVMAIAFVVLGVPRVHPQHNDELKNKPVEQALEAVRLAAASGNDAMIIEALDHGYPAVKSAALKTVTQKRIRAAMPKLIAMYAWLNSPNGGPIFTGGGPFWDEGRDPTAIELSSDIVAAIDSITGSAIPKPRDKTQAERTRYLNDTKAWWHSASNAGSVSAPPPVVVTSEQTSFPSTFIRSATPAASPQQTAPAPQTPAAQVEHRAPLWPWVVGIVALVALVAFVLKRRA